MNIPINDDSEPKLSFLRLELNQNYLIGNPSRRATVRGSANVCCSHEANHLQWYLCSILAPRLPFSCTHCDKEKQVTVSSLGTSQALQHFGFMNPEILKRRSCSTYQSLRAITGLARTSRTTKTTIFFLMGTDRWSLNESGASTFSLYHNSTSLHLSQPLRGFLMVFFSLWSPRQLCVLF